MTLKIIRGLAGQLSSAQASRDPKTENTTLANGPTRPTSAAVGQAQAQAQQTTASSAATISNLVRTSEAVVSTVKSVSKALTGEPRIKDISEARDVANRVSQDVRRDEGAATAAHGTLSGNDARDHFAE